ncbi:MAG: hypothetical protein GY835_18580 [bacterium]|nr:hypothetical protein [bacterium]
MVQCVETAASRRVRRDSVSVVYVEPQTTDKQWGVTMMNRLSTNILVLLALAGALVSPADAANTDAGSQAELLVGLVASDFGEAGSENGSCVLVGRKDSSIFAVISDHVVHKPPFQEEPRIVVKLQQCNREEMVAQLTSHRDKQFDLAVLKLPDTCPDGSKITAPAMALGRLDAVHQGSPAYTIGQGPNGSWQRNIKQHHIEKVEWLQLRIEPGPPVGPGLSGGGLFSDDWRLIGMIRGGEDTALVAVRIDAIIDRLGFWNVPVNLWGGLGKCEMAIELLTGRGGSVDIGQAFRLFQDAAAEGDPLAQMWIAIAKNHGGYTLKLDVSGAAETARKAVAMVRKLAEGGDPHAQYLFANAYATGLGIERDLGKGKALLGTSCDNGFLLSCCRVAANRIAADPSPEEMVNVIADLKQLCDAQVLVACVYLGWVYQWGRGVVKNQDKAEGLYENACEAGHPAACWRLGKHYPKTSLHAAQFFETSCLGGDRRGCRYLGSSYEDGEGIARDYAAAGRFFLKACDHGEWWSCWRRGRLIEKGHVDGTDEERLLMLRLGCTGSVGEACRDLGKADFDRAKRADDKRGMKEAFALFDQACELDNYDACKIALYLHGKYDLAPPREAGAYAASVCELMPIVSSNRSSNPYTEVAKTCLAGASWLSDKKRDYGRAGKLLKRGCDNRNAEACLRAAKAILNGGDGRTDAYDLLERGCNFGNVEACGSAADLLARKKGKESSSERFEMLEKACKLGDKMSCKRRVELFFDTSRQTYCSCEVVQAARNFCLQDGDLRSCTFVGYCNSIDYYRCREGNRENADKQAGLAYLERGCDGGDLRGCYYLGKALAEFASMEQLREDKEEYYQRAFIAYSKACDLRSPLSCYKKGLYLHLGRGTAKNPSEAALVYESPCRNGIASACNNLGSLYAHGKGVPENLEKAAQLFRQACKGGERKSCQNLLDLCSKLPATGPCELPLPQ